MHRHGAEQTEDVDVRIDLAHAQRTALGIAFDPRPAEAEEQAGDQEYGGPHPRREPGGLGVQTGSMAQAELARGPIGMNFATERHKEI